MYIVHIVSYIFDNIIIYRALESLRTEGRGSRLWESISLAEVIKTLEDLIDYFAPPSEELGKLEHTLYSYMFMYRHNNNN